MDKALIAAVLKRESLWNSANDLHKNAVVLKKLWEEVAFELQKDMKIVKARWKNLRAYFFKEHQKNEKLKSDGADKITSTWQYYNELMFLKGFPVNTGKDPNFSGVYDYLKVEPISDEEQNSGQFNTCSETIPSHNHAQADSHDSPNYIQAKRKKLCLTNKTVDEDQYLLMEKKNPEIHEKNIKEKNSDSLFFDSLLPYMANIPLARKLRLRSKIQDLILAEIEAEVFIQ